MPCRPTLSGCSPWKIASAVTGAAFRSGSCGSTADFHSFRTPIRISSFVVFMSVPRALSAVDVQDFPGDEPGVLQVDDRVDYVVDVAHLAHRVQAVQELVRFGRVHRGADDAERDRIDADALRRVLDGQ